MKTMKTRQGTCLALTTLGLLAACAACPLRAQVHSLAEVYINSTPPGAAVAINRRTAGVTPLTLDTLPPGRHLLSFTLRGYRTRYQTLSLSAGQRAVVDLPLEPLHGLVLIHASPDGADVTVDGVHRGQTPVLITDLPFGQYRAHITKAGFVHREMDLLIDSRIPKRFSANLMSDAATLNIRATPNGAAVLINGVAQGETPLTLDRVRTGEVSLSITAPGYHPFTDVLTLVAGEVRDIQAALQSVPSSLRILTVPGGARIHVNGQFRGRAPVTLTDINEGDYAIRAELDAHDTVVHTLHVSRGQDHVEELTLTPNAGRIELTTEPAGVRVLLNDVLIGETEAGTNQTDKLSATFIAPMIRTGTHELLLVKAGFHPLTETIAIERNETFTGHYTLRRRFIPNLEVRTATGIYRGVHVETDTQRNIKLELHPGIFKTIYRGDITAVTPLRVPELPDAPP